MYICICNAVNEKTVEAAIDAGARTVAELSMATGLATGCGQCADVARKMLDERGSGYGSRSAPGLFQHRNSVQPLKLPVIA